VQVVIDAQVSHALHRLGVPTRQEIADLTKRIEKLTASIDALKVKR
jgi:polyhydroxyalkanoate synthesis regulator phasin